MSFAEAFGLVGRLQDRVRNAETLNAELSRELVT